MSEPNNVTQRSLTYLKSHHSEGIHIAGLGGVYGINRIRPNQFRCEVTRKAVDPVPIPDCLSCGVGEDERIAEAGNAGSSVFVDKDVCLTCV